MTLATSCVSTVVWIHLVGAVVDSRPVRRAVRISLVGVMIHALLVGLAGLVHLVRVVVSICLFLLIHAPLDLTRWFLAP